MSTRHTPLLALTGVCLLMSSAVSADVKKRDTIKSLEKKDVEIRSGTVIINSTDLARNSYRDFLDLTSEAPRLRAEALRRLGDLELDATEAEQLAQNIDTVGNVGYKSAVDLYQQLLEAYPEYRRNDTVLYQLGRAYEMGGRTDEALLVLNELVQKYPNTSLIDEVEFRRGEMLFLRKDYDDAKQAYRVVVEYGEASRFYEQSLYKLGWSQYKLASHEKSLDPFFELLDRKISGIELQDGEKRLEQLSRANQELVEDTFRVLSISFSYMKGAQSIDDYLEQQGPLAYSYVIYRNLGDLYLEKERFVDAAEAYEAFVDQDPLHPKAPLLQVEVIEAYKRGGFPSLVLVAKKGFVERYGMDGPFWIHNPRAENTAVAAHLKAHLNDLAQYSHAEAQKKGQISDYQEAARWYRKYLAYFPGETDSANTNFLLAEVLFESHAFEKATDEYERTAYDYPLHERSAEAAYAAIVSYREHENALQEEARAAWHSRYLDSGLRFADTFSEHPESGAVLTTVAEDLFSQGEFDQAIAISQTVVARQPPVEARLARTAWTVIAHSQFDLDDYEAAEQAYYKLRAYTPAHDAAARQEIKDRIASSIYKQGEFARDMGFLEEAVTHFTRLGEVVPDSSIRATAEYDAAAALINLADWDRASGVLEKFRNDHPDSEFTDDITQKLAVSYLQTGRGADAASEFERIANAQASTDEVRREALWKAAELYEQSGAIEGEQRVLENILARYPNPLSESIEASYRLLKIAEETGDKQVYSVQLRNLVKVDGSAGSQRSDRTRYLAALASLELAEPVRRRFVVAKLTQPLAESLKLKRSLMEDVIEVYTDLADYGVAEVTTAATYRLGEVYQIFSADLMNSERPKNLDAAALEQYDILLEEQVYPFEEKAIDLYKANADRAPDGVYDEWVRKSFDQLASLMPGRYAKLERGENVVTALY